MKTILLTGFEPFGGSDINPSIEACKPHEDKKYGDCIVKVVEIPLIYDEIKPSIIKAIEETNPSAVICTGQGGTGEIRLERIGINVADARIAYNCGTQPVDRAIEPDGPAAYFSTLPLRKMLEALLEKKIPSTLSNSAGTFGCNHIFYELMHNRATHKLDIPAGFVHVPALPEQVIGKGRPSMSLSLITDAFGVILETVASGI